MPLIESPLFDAQLDSMELNDTERHIAVELNRNGYAVIDFPDPELDLRIERIKHRFAPTFGIDLTKTDSIKVGGDKRAQDAWQYDPDVRAIAGNPHLIALLSRLYGRQAFPFQTLNFPVGTQQTLHTDAVHFSSVPERFMCGVWLAMEDIGLDAGPLCYIPGSHRWPVLSNVMIGRRGSDGHISSAQSPYEETWQAIVQALGSEEVLFEARKGQALIWCANLLHGGSRQTDERRTRWSQVTHYYFDDCLYYTPAYSDEPLGHLALREVISVVDGEAKPNTYLGQVIEKQLRKKGVAALLRRSRKALGF